MCTCKKNKQKNGSEHKKQQNSPFNAVRWDFGKNSKIWRETRRCLITVHFCGKQTTHTLQMKATTARPTKRRPRESQKRKERSQKRKSDAYIHLYIYIRGYEKRAQGQTLRWRSSKPNRKQKGGQNCHGTQINKKEMMSSFGRRAPRLPFSHFLGPFWMSRP